MTFNKTNSDTQGVIGATTGGIGFVCAAEGTVAAGAAVEDTMSSEVRVG